MGRIEFIDTAKGIGICLVVFGHLGTSPILWSSAFIYSFHMPLFFFLSGIFFKEYEPMCFIKKKCKSLLIPFVWFYALTSIILPYFLNKFLNIELLYYKNMSMLETLPLCIVEEVFPNPPSWFLISIFQVSLIYYLFIKVLRLTNKTEGFVLCISTICGLIGLFFSYSGINIIGFLDTSMTSLPFFALGNLVFKNSKCKQQILNDRRAFAFVLFLFLIVISRFVYFDFRINEYSNGYLVYPLGAVGIYIVLQISIHISDIKWLNIIGKQSIIILCTHFIIIEFLQFIIDHVLGYGMYLNKMIAIAIFITTMLLEYYVVIPSFNKYLAFMLGKKL